MGRNNLNQRILGMDSNKDISGDLLTSKLKNFRYSVYFLLFKQFQLRKRNKDRMDIK